MKKKIIKTTHIDTGSHGYLSVSKKDFLLAGGDPSKISGCSGHTLTRIYLEEDCDQSYFWDVATANGFTIERKSGYNLNFSIKHNYKPELFNYSPRLNSVVVLSDKNHYEITEISKRIIVSSLKTGMKYKISLNNPFEHIQGVILIEPTLLDIDTAIKKAVNYQNHFYSHCCITNYYGKASEHRGVTPNEVRAKGERVYAYIRLGSPYKDGNPKGEVLEYTKEYEEIKQNVATLADYSR